MIAINASKQGDDLRVTMGREKLELLVCHQLKNFFMVEPHECTLLKSGFQKALKRVEKCFSPNCQQILF